MHDEIAHWREQAARLQRELDEARRELRESQPSQLKARADEWHGAYIKEREVNDSLRARLAERERCGNGETQGSEQ